MHFLTDAIKNEIKKVLDEILARWKADLMGAPSNLPNQSVDFETVPCAEFYMSQLLTGYVCFWTYLHCFSLHGRLRAL